jgi:hypothetical protein
MANEKLVVGVNRASNFEITAIEFTENSGWRSLQLNVRGKTTNILTASSGLQPFWTNADAAYQSDGSAMIVWNDDTSTPKYATKPYGGSWSSALDFPNINGVASWVVLASDPTSTDLGVIIGDNINDAGKVTFTEWDGAASRWKSVQFLQSKAIPHKAAVGIAYEGRSGRVMLTWGTSQSTAGGTSWQLWDGSSLVGNPSSISSFPGSRWTMLRAQPGTNSMLLGVMDSNRKFGFIWWNGSRWDGSKAFLPSGTSPSTVRPLVAVAFESLSGESLEVWADGSKISWRSRNSDGTQKDPPASLSSASTSLSLFSDPKSDKIVLLTQDSSSKLWRIVWDGSSWAGSMALVESKTGETKNQPFTFVWN